MVDHRAQIWRSTYQSTIGESVDEGGGGVLGGTGQGHGGEEEDGLVVGGGWFEKDIWV